MGRRTSRTPRRRVQRLLASPFTFLAVCFSSGNPSSGSKPAIASSNPRSVVSEKPAKTPSSQHLQQQQQQPSQPQIQRQQPSPNPDSSVSGIPDDLDKLIPNSPNSPTPTVSPSLSPASLDALPSPPSTNSPLSRLLYKRPPSLTLQIPPAASSRLSVEEQNALGILPGSPTIVLEPYDLVALNTPTTASASSYRPLSSSASQRTSVYSFNGGVQTVTTPVHEKSQPPFTVFNDNASKRTSVIASSSPISPEEQTRAADTVENPTTPTKPAGVDSKRTTVVLSRASILSDITNSAGARIVNKRVSMQISTEAIDQIDIIAWSLLHRVDGTFAFPPSISQIEQSLEQDGREAIKEFSADLLHLIMQRLEVAQERFLDSMYAVHSQEVGKEAECDTVCFATHLYRDFIDPERIRSAAALMLDTYDEEDEDYDGDDDSSVSSQSEFGDSKPDYSIDDGSDVPDKRYLQYAAVWRRVAEEIDLEGPHTAAEWWSLAELKFRVMKARMRHSHIEEIDRYLQDVLEQD
ncbi:hypothetical protein BZA70DRAFT_264844 [Myxozyma melibiosi]|uniref:Uncharacterized protein n=1 Tax=Myxozyma melibiosi TaxID=54550 RepID=A0ABR1FE79_9ASCO